MAKTSKRTEEEMLQETFAQFQTQSSTEENATESGDSAPGVVKSKVSKNNAILISSCIAAAGIVGYIFLLKPMLETPVAQQAAPVQANDTQVALTPDFNQAPVAPVAPVAPIQAPQVVQAPALDPIAQLQAQAAQTPVVMPAPMPVPVAPSAPVAPTFPTMNAQDIANSLPAPVAPSIPEAPIQAPAIDNFFAQGSLPTPVAPPAPVTPVAVAPEAVTPALDPYKVAAVDNQIVVPAVTDMNIVPVAPVTSVAPEVPSQSALAPSYGLDAQQANIVSELQNRFEAQNSEFKNLLNNVDGKVGVLETKVADHEQRIIRLESFHKGQKSKAKSTGNTSSTTAKSTVAHVKAGEGSDAKSNKSNASPKAQSAVKKIRPAVKHKESTDENVLFGSNDGKKKAKPKEVKKAEKPVLQELPIHSIYGGRFWVKNSDGSLSTYAAGDKLPTGEVVKSVSDEEFSITTNLRVIVKK